MPDTQIKICGLSTPETLDAAVDAGASHVGFVHFEKSPRHLSLEAAAKLRRRVPENVKLVLVTVAMQPEQLARAYDVIRPDVIQFHGSETPEWVALVRQTIKGVEAWRSFGLRDAGTLERARVFEGKADRLLFDAPAKALPGGNGVTAQWELLEAWQPFMPWALAGGLTPDNVGEAIRRTKAPLVDASSGLESAPGEKSVDLIRAFCDAVRAA
ncbi:phosphoribosylanthranilate isomerase [Qipengyuania sediminis]|uniref:phosphoribosylanthranilate isomerase n=1 Tax=Qipengyuania sediminis TaxID=1532023 RepID=UPI001059D745|nr:phosphoribosylanthranilate isomerase [Qipengyuania sediminis]